MTRMNNRSNSLPARRCAVLLALLASGCSFGDTLETYYAKNNVAVSGIDVTSEAGNIGGQTAVLTGSGFGSDANAVTVVFGSQNATVVSATDSSITVVVPRGPIEGGAVDISVGTAGGQATLADAYFYDTRLGDGVEVVSDDGPEDVFADEIAYIAVTNDYFSCGGGIGNIWANPDLLLAYGWTAEQVAEGPSLWTGTDDLSVYSPYETFCNEGLTFGSPVGIDGRAEQLEFKYPRLHSLFAGYRNGFGGNFDVSPNKWSVQVPSQDIATFDIENFYAELRTEINDFVITNVDVQELSENVEWCADMSAMAEGTLIPTDGATDPDGCAYGELSINGPYYEPIDCNASMAKRYNLSEMKFCQADDYENTRSYRYEAEWPVGEYFFKGKNADGQLDMFAPARIRIDVPEAGITNQEVVLPEAAVFRGTTGWNTDVFGLGATSSLIGIYGLTGFKDTCADSDEDGVTSGMDTAAVIQWKPSSTELSVGGDVVGGRTYVRFTVTAAGFGWYGGEGAVLKATISVPDNHNVDESGISTLEIPASVMYQIPSMLQNFGGIAPLGTDSIQDTCGDIIPGAEVKFEWASPEVVNYGFVITQIERITEYAVYSAALDGNLVFAYSTGDIGYTVFGSASDGTASWLNPAEGGTTCGDCTDNDGDGWTDGEDVDCQPQDLDGDRIPDEDPVMLVEDNRTFGRASCNDGEDNDNDGDIDSADSDCDSPLDEESDCADRLDNDEDGYTDRDDPDCSEAGVGYENGFSDFECNDGIDNDGDGAIDADEPECGSAVNFETNCNDGEDNDGDALVDGDDPECQDSLDGVENHVDNTDTSCNDGADNDGDGWVDLNDPDCPTLLGEEVGFGTTECNDGIDNDGNGDIDTEDVTCLRFGALSDEAPTLTAACADSSDNDGDGYIDGHDPDCEYPPFSLERELFHEPGRYPNVPACYNGVDDDIDGNTDAADPDCVNGSGEPSGFIRAEDADRPGCTNGADDDADGWTDIADPDCASGDDEVGFGATECNDGVDNDSDGAIDGDDVDCADASDVEAD